MDWTTWRRHFEANAERPLPLTDDPARGVPDAWRAPLVRSLARFQIGETGEGRIAREIHHVALDGIDDDYRVALGLFVREEGRHARILAELVRGMGGALLAKSRVERAFRGARRIAGVREKLVVLLVAEIVGIAFYAAVAARLPHGTLRAALASICDDEIAHLGFHRDFFCTQVRTAADVLALRAACVAGAVIAGGVVLVDHAPLLRAVGAPWRDVAAAMFAMVDETLDGACAHALAASPRRRLSERAAARETSTRAPVIVHAT